MRVMTKDWDAAVAAGYHPVNDPTVGAFFFDQIPDVETLEALAVLDDVVVICPIAGLTEETDFATWLLGYQARREQIRRASLAGREKAIAEGRFKPGGSHLDFGTQAFIRNCVARGISQRETARLAGVNPKTVARLQKKMRKK